MHGGGPLELFTEPELLSSNPPTQGLPDPLPALLLLTQASHAEFQLWVPRVTTDKRNLLTWLV